jgi:predicted acetyltransferase
MHVELVSVPKAEAGKLRALLDPYLIEHADLVDPDRVHGDPTDQPYFDLYWVEPERAPLWILVDGRQAGFVLLNAYSPSGRGTERAISEFCVLPEFRRGGIGKAAAIQALATHKGQWEFQVHRANSRGFPFWPEVLAAAAVSDRETIELEDLVIHRFRT